MVGERGGLATLRVLGGLTTKLLWSFLGLCLPVLVLSGAYLSWRRSGVVGGGKTSSDQLATPWWLRYPIRTVVLLPLMLVLVWSCIEGYVRRGTAPKPFIGLGAVEIGPWRAAVSRESTSESDGSTKYAVVFNGKPSEAASFREAKLCVQRGNGGDCKTPLNGPAYAMRGVVNGPFREIGRGNLPRTHRNDLERAKLRGIVDRHGAA